MAVSHHRDSRPGSPATTTAGRRRSPVMGGCPPGTAPASPRPCSTRLHAQAPAASPGARHGEVRRRDASLPLRPAPTAALPLLVLRAQSRGHEVARSMVPDHHRARATLLRIHDDGCPAPGCAVRTAGILVAGRRRRRLIMRSRRADPHRAPLPPDQPCWLLLASAQPRPPARRDGADGPTTRRHRPDRSRDGADTQAVA